MTIKIKHRILSFLKAIIIPFCILLVCAGYMNLFGLNLITGILFWFVIVPSLTLYLSKILLGSKNITRNSILELIGFYGLMVFLIYKHYQSDLFKLMIASLVFNLFLFIATTVAKLLIDKYTPANSEQSTPTH